MYEQNKKSNKEIAIIKKTHRNPWVEKFNIWTKEFKRHFQKWRRLNHREEQISNLEDKRLENTQWGEQKSMKTLKENLQKLHDTVKANNIHIMGKRDRESDRMYS